MAYSSPLWELNEAVCFRKANGKIIWQPRIECWIADKLFENGELPGRYKGMNKQQLYRDLGCSARIYDCNESFIPIYDKSIRIKKETKGQDTIHVIETPCGAVSRIERSTPSSWAKIVVKQWIETEEDLNIYTYIERHTDWMWSQSCYDKTMEKWAPFGAPSVFIPRTNIQRLYIDLMGVENTVYALADCPEKVEAYFSALRENQMKLLDVINASPIRLINFGDNIHSGTLSPALFARYVLPDYQLRCEKLHAAGKFVSAHFDGNNRGLMQYYQETGLDGIEAITPFPQGDVTLEEVKENLGNMFLIDGIPAVYFDETYSIEDLQKCVYRIIELFAPNLVLGISDEISSTGDIERIRFVGKIVDAYNAQIERTT